MVTAFTPGTAEELAEALVAATTPFDILGSGSRSGLGRPVTNATPLSTARFAGITLYDPAELIIEAGAATQVAEIEAALAAKGQQLAFEPPASGTIGGAVACNVSGPRRIKAGALRDHLLGVSGVSGRGENFKAGSRVVKNVTGYDLPKLMAGSFGTLAVLTSVTLKVMPRPETSLTLRVKTQTAQAAVRAMSDALQSPWEVSAAAFVPGRGTYLRLEGFAASVAYRAKRLGEICPGTEDAAADIWKELGFGLAGDCLWRVSLPPMAAPAYLEALRSRLDFDYRLDWGGGLVWIACATPAVDAIRGLLPSGHATLVRAPEEERARVPVFQPQPDALFDLTRRVKTAFDPRGVLNPGRMYESV